MREPGDAGDGRCSTTSHGTGHCAPHAGQPSRGAAYADGEERQAVTQTGPAAGRQTTARRPYGRMGVWAYGQSDGRRRTAAARRGPVLAGTEPAGSCGSAPGFASCSRDILCCKRNESSPAPGPSPHLTASTHRPLHHSSTKAPQISPTDQVARCQFLISSADKSPPVSIFPRLISSCESFGLHDLSGPTTLHSSKVGGVVEHFASKGLRVVYAGSRMRADVDMPQ